MSALSIQPTYPIFTETDGLPLENGYIWIGTANLDPQGNPINVYWDAALTIQAAQPIRTLNGYPSRNGTPARLYVNSNYSIRVQNSKGSLVYSAPEALERYSGDLVSFTGFKGQVGTVADLAGDDGSDWIGFEGPGASVARSAQDKMRDVVSVKDFGAIGDGVADDTPAIQNAFSYCDPIGVMLYFPKGIYKITSPISIPRGGAFGDSVYATQILVDIPTATSATNAITYGVSGDYTASRSGISSMWIKIADYSKVTTMLYLDTPNHNSFMRDVKIDTGKGYCVKAAEFFTFYFDNVTFIGRYTATPGPLDPLEGVGFSNVGATEINNVLFNKCTFTFLRKPLEATSGYFQGSNAIKFNQCLFESIGENIGNIEGYQANFDCCYFEALNKNQNAALTYSAMKGGANNIVFDQCLLNFTTISTTLPLFDMQIGSVLFNDNTSLELPGGFTGTVIDKKTYGVRGQLIDNWSRYPVENAFLAVPAQWCGGYATSERPASPSFKAYSIARFEYEFNGLTTNASFQISEFLEGFVQLKYGVAYYVNIEAEINYRNNTTGQVSYLKSNQSWYISGTETGSPLAANATDNSQISDAGGFLTGAWLANNTLRYQATGIGYRRFALYRQTKTGTAYPATVSTKYKVRISPTSTTLDNSVVGIVDGGNV